MGRKQVVIIGLSLLGAFASGLAQARDELQWSVTIGSPIGVPVYRHPVPVVRAPVVVVPPQRYQRPTRWDRDGDGVPNRYDAVYNPAWDRDGDGVPNRYDRDDRRHDRHDHGAPNWHDAHDDDRGGDGRWRPHG